MEPRSMAIPAAVRRSRERRSLLQRRGVLAHALAAGTPIVAGNLCRFAGRLVAPEADAADPASSAEPLPGIQALSR